MSAAATETIATTTTTTKMTTKRINILGNPVILEKAQVESFGFSAVYRKFRKIERLYGVLKSELRVGDVCGDRTTRDYDTCSERKIIRVIVLHGEIPF